MTKQGIQWINCAFWMFVFKQISIVKWDFFFPSIQIHICVNTQKTGDTLIYLIQHFLFRLVQSSAGLQSSVGLSREHI